MENSPDELTMSPSLTILGVLLFLFETGSHYTENVSLKLTKICLPVSAPWLLKLKACTTMSNNTFLKIIIIAWWGVQWSENNTVELVFSVPLHGARDQTQVIRLVWQSPSPAESSQWPQKYFQFTYVFCDPQIGTEVSHMLGYCPALSYIPSSFRIFISRWGLTKLLKLALSLQYLPFSLLSNWLCRPVLPDMTTTHFKNVVSCCFKMSLPQQECVPAVSRKIQHRRIIEVHSWWRVPADMHINFNAALGWQKQCPQ